jgi:WD40 repeat protein
LEHFDTIHNSPSQIYHSALPLSPSSSWLYKYYATELIGEVKVVKGPPAGWGICSRKVTLDEGPHVLACWKDTIAVGLESSNITLLSAITGSQMAVLSGHTGGVGSLAFSSDGTLLVSGSSDKTLKLWDIQTGGVVKTFLGHTSQVCSVSISADCTTIASGSDGTICLWYIQTGECYCVIKEAWVAHVVFSPTDPQHLISASLNAVQQWDIDGHRVGPAHTGFHTAFSSDGPHFFSGEENISTVRKSDSGAVVATCLVSSGSNPYFNASCFSPSGRLVAAATFNAVFVWDITGSNPLLIEASIGHVMAITSLVFSSPSTLILASTDNSIKFLQIGGLSTNTVADDSESVPPTSSPVMSVSLHAESGIAISSDLDGVLRVWDISTGLCVGSSQTPTRGEEWRDAQIIDGKLIFVWLQHSGLNIWDSDRDKLLHIEDIYSSGHQDLRISGDGSKVFRLHEKVLQAWSVETGGRAGWVQLGYGWRLDPLCMDGSRIQVCSKDNSTQVWDFGIPGSSPTLVSYTSSERPHLHSIHPTPHWVEFYGPSRVKDTITGKKVFWLSGRYAEPSRVRQDGQYLVAGYHSGEVLILDFNHLHL